MFDLDEAIKVSGFYNQCGMLAMSLNDIEGAAEYFKLAQEARQIVIEYNYLCELNVLWNPTRAEA